MDSKRTNENPRLPNQPIPTGDARLVNLACTAVLEDQGQQKFVVEIPDFDDVRTFISNNNLRIPPAQLHHDFYIFLVYRFIQVGYIPGKVSNTQVSKINRFFEVFSRFSSKLERKFKSSFDCLEYMVSLEDRTSELDRFSKVHNWNKLMENMLEELIYSIKDGRDTKFIFDIKKNMDI